MKYAIVYDSFSPHKTTRRAAEEMAGIVRAAGHEVYLAPVKEAEVQKVRDCDVICIGSWTQGLFFFFQHATERIHTFMYRLRPINAKRACVFCTFKTSYGKMLEKMADELRASGAVVTGLFSSRWPHASPDFIAWMESLEVPTRSEVVAGFNEEF